MALPETGMRAVLENADGFAKDAKKVENATLSMEASLDKVTSSASGTGQGIAVMTPALDALEAKWGPVNKEIDAFLASSEASIPALSGFAGAMVAAAPAIGAVASALVTVTAGLVTMIYKLGEAGAPLLRVEAAFDALAASGGGSAELLREAMDDAAEGLVDDTQLMMQANKLMASGVQLDTKQTTAILEMARVKAHDYGITTAQAFQTITDAIARGTPGSLKSLGIFVSATQAMEDYGTATGGAAGEVDQSTRSQAVMASVLEEVERQLDESGTAAGDYADNFERVNVTVGEAGDTIKQYFTPAAAEMARLLNKLLQASIDTFESLVIFNQAAKEAAVALLTGGDATEVFNAAVTRLKNPEGDLGEAARWAAIGLQYQADAARASTDAFSALIPESLKLVNAMSGLMNEEAKAAEKAGQDVVDAQEKAAKEGEKAWADYTDKVAALGTEHVANERKIASQIEQVNADLIDAMLEADRQYAADRLALEQEMADALAAADQQLARDQEALRAQLSQDLADLDRQYNQDRQDMATQLARDMEGIERGHQANLLELQEARLAASLALEQDYAERLKALEQRYADERAAIEERYRTEPKKLTAEEEREARRAALAKELEDLQAAREREHGIASYREDEILTELESLKNEELAALDERKAAELEALKAWLAEEQAAQDEAYQIALDAEQAAYQAQQAERLLQYEQDLIDLRTAHQREEEERRTDFERRMGELQARHVLEEAEIVASYNRQLDALDAKHAEEEARLAEQAAKQTARLAAQLLEEEQSYRDRQAALGVAYDKQKASIEQKLDDQKKAIDAKLLKQSLAWIDSVYGLETPTGQALEKILRDTWMPEMQKFIDDAQWMADQVKAIIEGLPQAHSPSPWAQKAFASIREGMELGLDMPGLARQVGDFGAEMAASIGGLAAAVPQSAYGRVDAPALPALPSPQATNVSNSKSVNLHYTGQTYSEPSLRALVTMMEVAAGG